MVYLLLIWGLSVLGLLLLCSDLGTLRDTSWQERKRGRRSRG